ncbi:MAG: 4Fe-4S binding protein [Ignavibacteriae bacterium]|nr:4Fe-4S binding protein [Ignavibacteriota bacterium]
MKPDNTDSSVLTTNSLTFTEPFSKTIVDTFQTIPHRAEARKLKIKKIPTEQRKKKIKFSLEPLWYKRIVHRLRDDSQFLRSTIQFSFILLCVWIGIEFYLFMQWGMSNGETTYFERPPGVEGFLPISALISLKYWLQTGIINDVHPSGLFIFIAIVAGGVLLKKAFCSWLCPVGTLSESLWMFGKKLFGRNLTPPKWLDYPLRSLKYLLLFFFAYSIWQMTVPDLQAFIYSPYNKMADVKMYQFFANISSFALWTIIILMVFSLFIKNFWCRFLCPYGALLGVLSWFSPLKITRNKSTCIDCELCTKACPSNIKVHKVKRVWSDECMNCLACVEACPVKETLDIRTSVTKTRIPNWVFGVFVVGTFAGITGLAMITGHWQNGMTKEEYLKRFPQIESPIYQHNRGEVPQYGPND